jgi:DNA-binding LytR/AlgR family response regulator
MVKKFNCIVLDPDETTLKTTGQYIQNVPFFNLTGSYSTVFEAMTGLVNQKIDLMFCETVMPGFSGTEFVSNIVDRPKVVFITSHKEYALEAFDLNVVDYILKPIQPERFMSAVHKAWVQLNYKEKKEGEALSPDTEYLFVTSNYALIKVNLRNVTHIEGLKDYIKIYTSDQQSPILTRMTMKSIEERLPTDAFFRAHKSFIVSIAKIDMIRNQRIQIGNHLIPISDNNYDIFKQRINA